MLELETNNKNLRIRLEDGPHRAALEKVLEGLIMAKKSSKDPALWSLDWLDFKRFRAELDARGLIEGRDASDSALDWVAAHTDYEAKVEAIRSGNSLLDVPAAIKTKLFKEQQAGMTFLLQSRGTCLADEMGIGKSLQVLAAYAKLRELGETGPLLIICPNSVKPGWLKEIAKHSTLKGVVGGNSVEEIKDAFELFTETKADILVVHYQSIVSRKGPFPQSEFAEKLAKLNFAAIAVDEAHQVKNLTAKRSASVKYLVDTVKTLSGKLPRIWLITGTPVSERPLDAWSVFVYTGQPVPSYGRFYRHFTEEREVKYGMLSVKEITGWKNLPDLKDRLHAVMIRRMKADIPGFPEKSEQTRYLHLEGAQLVVYNQFKRALVKELTEDTTELTLSSAMERIIRLRQILNSPELVGKEKVGSVKEDVLDDILEEVLEDPLQKVIVWTEYREAVTRIANRYKKKYGTIALMGGVSQDRMTELGHTWDTSPERVAVGTPAFGGTGVDWLSRCRTAVYMEVPYSTVLFRQSMDRIHRRVAPQGASAIDKIKASPASIIYLHVEGSVDDLVWEVVSNKGSVVDAVLTDTAKLIMQKSQLLRYLK